MIKVNIKNLINGIKFGNILDNIEQANAWISENESNSGWGYSARWIKDSECPESHRILINNQEQRIAQESYEKPIFKKDANDQPVMEEYSYYDLDNVLQLGFRHVVDHYETVPATYETWVHLKAEYEITIEDITTQYEAEQELQELIAAGEKDAQCCNEIKALIGGYNKKRDLSIAQVQEMITTFANINECLRNNMPGTAKLLMLVIEPSEIVPQDLINKANIIFAKYGI